MVNNELIHPHVEAAPAASFGETATLAHFGEEGGAARRDPRLSRRQLRQAALAARLKLRPEAIRLAVALLILSLGWTACSSKEGGEKEPVVTVQVATANAASIERKVRAEAILYPLRQAAITPKISAPVRKFYVERGRHVKAGQLLAELENRDLAAAETENQGAYQQAQATYNTTVGANVPEELQKAELDFKAAKQSRDAQQKVYENRQKLYQEGAAPRKDVEDALVNYTQARNQYEIAQKHLEALQAFGRQEELKAAQGQLTSAKGKYEGAQAQFSYSEIRSPIDGVVTDRPLYAGEMAGSGSPLITVMDTSQVIARAHISQQEAAALRVGNGATLSAPGEDDVKGKVTVVSPALDPNSTTVEVWVQAPNPQGRLRPGTSVHVSIMAETLSDALVVPAAAVLTSADGTTSIMVVDNDSKAHQRNVKTGVRDGDDVQITEGLKAGERVITVGAYGLPDNTKVQVAEGSPEKEEGGGAKGGDKH